MPERPFGDPKGAEEPKPKHPQKPEVDQTEEEEGLDKTIADSFPASDPPSTIPDPEEDKENAA